MLKILKTLGLRYVKGIKSRILLGLLCNFMLFIKWKLYKVFHGIHHPVVHYYTVCWNEEKMLPFMFYHYDAFISKYIIYDNESTDASCQIIRKHPNTRVVSFETTGFNDEVQNRIKNQCWKASRGKADYVIVCDLDEFFYVPDVNKFIEQLQSSNISLPYSIGYDMCCSKFPEYTISPSLTEKIRTGVQNKDYSKCIFFSPYKIVEINYEPGAHFCHPYGIVRSSERPLYKVLHYKYLGVDYVMERAIQYRMRMSSENIEKGYATQYLEKEDAILKKIQDKIDNAKIVW